MARFQKTDERGGYFLQSGLFVSWLNNVRNNRYGTTIPLSDMNEYNQVNLGIMINPSAIINISRHTALTLGVICKYDITDNFSDNHYYGHIASVSGSIGLNIKI